MNVQSLPLLNATLNGIAGILLIIGFIAIKHRHDMKQHARFMISALVVSAIFLGSYLYYHFNIQFVTRYQGEGFWRAVYYFILFTHIPLAGLVVPASLAAIWFASRKQFDRHTLITKRLWPVWMYVSVTGVLIYLMLYVF